ncbi:ATP-binding protein [Celerinatantimonas yamalensis]|uniref:histidine kinase n=1 Tax=Celerinatantimonas yamalensis TaxID=559956 RepID=A0ABW9G9J5_9GAMM
MAIITTTFSLDFKNLFFSQIKSKAEIQSNQIAQLKSLSNAIENNDILTIKRIMDPLAKQSDASYLVIGDKHAKHLYHSNPPAHMSLYMVGGDNKPVLSGKHIVTIRKGGMGYSLRSKTPIFNNKHQVIGIVSVGYLVNHIEHLSYAKMSHIMIISFLSIICLFYFCWLLSKNLKKHMLSMEPDEIAYVVKQQKILLENIYEGIIGIDNDLVITHINQSARQIFDPSKHPIIGRKIDFLIKDKRFFNRDEMLNKDLFDQLITFNNKSVIASRIRLFINGRLLGWVVSFRDENDIKELSKQLSQIKKYTDNLRILRHEQLNWTATLAGLLHLGRYKEAIDYIELQSSDTQGILDFISKKFSSPYLCGLLIGKYSSAKEKGISIMFDPACELKTMPSSIGETEFISVIGNIIDNAIEATLKSNEIYPIEVYLSENDNEVIIEVSDQGIGISLSDINDIFVQGYTSKQSKGNHGLGLHLVSSYIKKANGIIEISHNVPSGICCSIFIPKQALTKGLTDE